MIIFFNLFIIIILKYALILLYIIYTLTFVNITTATARLSDPDDWWAHPAIIK